MSRLPPVSDAQANAFIAACLTPLPEGLQHGRHRSGDAALVRREATALRKQWHSAEAALNAISCAQSAAMYAAEAGMPSPTLDCSAALQRRFEAAIDTLMRLPAPGRRQLRWKALYGLCDRPAWNAAIAADAARLELRP